METDIAPAKIVNQYQQDMRFFGCLSGNYHTKIYKKKSSRCELEVHGRRILYVQVLNIFTALLIKGCKVIPVMQCQVLKWSLFFQGDLLCCFVSFKLINQAYLKDFTNVNYLIFLSWYFFSFVRMIKVYAWFPFSCVTRWQNQNKFLRLRYLITKLRKKKNPRCRNIAEKLWKTSTADYPLFRNGQGKVICKYK